MHELLFAAVSLYFCNKPIRSIIATPHTIQINGSCDQTFKIDLFLVQELRSCTTQVSVIVEVACTWWYTCVHAKTRMSLRMQVLRVFHTYVSHKRVTCEFSACTHLCSFKLRVTYTVFIHSSCQHFLICICCTHLHNWSAPFCYSCRAIKTTLSVKLQLLWH